MANRGRIRATEVELVLALMVNTGTELAAAIAENPRTRRCAERFASALLLACSASEVQQHEASVISIGKTKGGERG